VKRAPSISPNRRPAQVSFCPHRFSGSCAARLPRYRPRSSRWDGRSKATMRRKKSMVQPTHGLSCAGLVARQDKCGWRLAVGASFHIALQQKIFHSAPSLPYFPCLSLGHSLRCFSRARRHSAFCFALRAPFGSGFPNKKSSAQSTRGSGPKTWRDFFFGASSERHAFGTWERGTSRRFAQECPEGNPGKYKQGETPWHSTKTKSR
jgi:hypothetical protein